MAKTRRLNTHWLKVGLAGGGALVAVGGAAALVQPPPLTPVAVLKQSVGALTPVPASAIEWVNMAHPPRGTVTAWAGQPLAAMPLSAGTVLNQADFTTAEQALGLKAGEVRYVVTITPASAPVLPGERVDVWSLPVQGSSGTAPQELAMGARVVGLYTAQGTPVATTTVSGGLLSSNTAPSAPALAALAVPQDALPSLMANNPTQTVLLIEDPTMTRFALVTGPSTSSTPPPTGHAGSTGKP